MALDPANGEALMGKARALVALERTGEAREWLDRFRGRSDTEPTAATWWGSPLTPRATGSPPTASSTA